MKQFEHEVLNFDISTDKKYAGMQQTLREWGEVGFEVISVVPASLGFDVINVFFKREIAEQATGAGEAAG